MQECKKILLAEDEKNLAFNLQLNLRAEGFEVFLAENGKEALKLYHLNGPFSVIILDVMMPEVNGFDVAQEIRKFDDVSGILMLTARAADEDRLKGLEIGVDDYLTKPFHLQELMLRVKRMSDRSKILLTTQFKKNTPEENLKYLFGPFTLDIESLSLKSHDKTIALTALECDLLKEFMQNPEKILSRTHLLEKVWKMPGNLETRTVDNFILRLRKILEDEPNKPQYLVSVRGRGYRLTLPELFG